MMQILSQECRITKVADAATAATTAVNSAGVDMSEDGGWESVIFFTSYATAAANNLINVQASDDDGVADGYSDIAGGEVDLSGTSDEDQFVDVLRPPKRFIRCVASRGTSSALGDIWAIRYRGRTKPIVQNIAGTIVGKALVQPAEGTK